MKINLNRGELKRLLAAVKLVRPTRSTVPVLQHVLLRAAPDHLTIYATNLEEHLYGVADAVVEELGSALVPIQTLKDLVKGKTADVLTLVLAGDTELTITSPVADQSIRQQVQTIAVTEWPEMPAADIQLQTINTTKMLSAYARVLPAISTDPTRYALHGVYSEPEHGELVATDGRRMYIASAAVQGWPEAIWPNSRVLASDLLHDANGQMAVVQKAEDHTVMAIAANGWHYQAKCVAAKYPRYQNVVPGPQQFSHSVDLAADATLVQQAVTGFGLSKKDVACLYNDAMGVRLVHSTDNGCVHVELPNSPLDGDLGDSEHVVLGWYVQQLLDTLAAGFTRVRIQADQGDHRPVRCDSPDGSGCAVIMPLRLGPETTRRIVEHFSTKAVSTAPVFDAPQPDPPAITEYEPPNTEDTPDMNQSTPNTTSVEPSTVQPHKPDLRMVEPPEPVDPITELDTLVGQALEAVKETRDRLLAVKTQLRLVKADHRQKERDTRSTQILLDKLKNAAGF